MNYLGIFTLPPSKNKHPLSIGLTLNSAVHRRPRKVAWPRVYVVLEHPEVGFSHVIYKTATVSRRSHHHNRSDRVNKPKRRYK